MGIPSNRQHRRCVIAPTFTHLLLIISFFTATEKHLQTLRKTQREKIEEFKKKTDYYKTRTLLERFDEAPSGSATGAATGLSLSVNGGSPPRNRSVGAPTPAGTPQRPAQGLAPLQTPGRPAQAPSNFSRAWLPSSIR